MLLVAIVKLNCLLLTALLSVANLHLVLRLTSVLALLRKMPGK